MNTNKKHKSKNKNKPPNPNQTEKGDIVTQSDDVKEVQESETMEKLISEVPVTMQSEPEIVGASPHVLTESDLEPKKPKRNKNKKKKQGNEADTLPESSDKVPELKEEQITEKTDSIQEKEINSSITPIARINNKQKKDSDAKVVQPAENVKSETSLTGNDPAVSDANVSLSKDAKDEKTEQDVKSQKKKNKKKKRHDSERSEKAEEVISCTAAFQKLLDVKTDKSEKEEGALTSPLNKEKENISEPEQKIVIKPFSDLKEFESDVSTNKKKNKKNKNSAIVGDETQEKTISEVSNPEPQKKHVEEKKYMIEDSINKVEGLVTKGRQPEPKSKATIAKPVERKQKQKTEIPEQQNKDIETTTTVAASDVIKPVSLVDILSEKSKEEDSKITSPETKIETSYTRTITPEENQDKELGNLSVTKNISTKKSTHQTTETKVSDALVKQNILEPESMPMTVAKKVDEVLEKKENTMALIAKPIPPTKKEKKSHKKHEITEPEKTVQEHCDMNIEEQCKDNHGSEKTEGIIEEERNKSHTEPENKEENLENVMTVASENKELIIDLILPEQKKENKSKKHEKRSKQSSEKVLVAAESQPLDLQALSQSDDDNLVLPSLLDIIEDIPKGNDCKLTKAAEVSLKQEKTDKIQCETQEPTQILSLEAVPKPESSDELHVPSSKRKKRKNSPKPPINVKLEFKPEEKESNVNVTAEKQIPTTSVQQPIEITNVESDHTAQIESKCQLNLETTPNLIEYPRSMSDQCSDTNNNTSIQEVSAADPVKLEIPVVTPDTPFIKGSGETPDKVTDSKISCVEFTEMKCSLPTRSKEKTDLKSKVMEVNQDMEDLRLSLERSLAELTSLEDKEKKIEKAYEQKLELSVTLENTEQEKLTIHENIKSQIQNVEPILPPPRQEGKGKGKSKKKNKQDIQQNVSQASNTQTQQPTSNQPSESNTSADEKKGEKSDGSEQKSESTQEKTKQQTHVVETQNAEIKPNKSDMEDGYAIINKAEKSKHKQDKYADTSDSKPVDYEPIDNFEDAMTSSLDDVNKSFEIIAKESTLIADSSNNPQISVTAPEEDTAKKDAKQKIHPVSQPKNLLGHPDIPVPSNRTDYKKEKNKPPNARQAKVKIKDTVEIEPKSKESKESQTDAKNKFLKKDSTVEESVTCVTSENEEYVYKYSFRKVFLPNICHICKKELKGAKVPCNYCSLIFYCSEKHKDEGWSQHQALCFAVSTVAHHKNQKHIYADAQGVTGQEYRLFRMQLIVACEKVLRRRLVPWEQEAVLYPRICADVACREYRQGKLMDCDGCGQISYCAASPDHLPKSHQKWCKSYSLYQKLVLHQQTQGRLAPKLPTRVLSQAVQIPDKINMVLASLYEEKIDMNDIQYAALTQIATAPLTAAYSFQLYNKSVDAGRFEKNTFTIHLVNAELQYEADVLNKWERLFLHLQPTVEHLNVVMTGRELNPDQLPLALLGKIKLCANCRLHSRRLIFSFQDKTYTEYWDSNDFETPDIVCAFNPSIQRSMIYIGKNHWPITIQTIFKLKCPFLITSYTMSELNRDINRIKECSKGDFRVISEAKFNPFASVRPDRNFITDDEIPLLFKNYCFAVLCGV